jgi:hypothetical protein
MAPMKGFFTLLLILAGMIACQSKQNGQANKLPFDTDNLLADTISYPTIVKNPDLSDTWTTKCLEPLNRKVMVDKLFDAVYNHGAIAYDYFTHQPLSIEEVKKIEQKEDFSRDKVGKLQFWESWFFSEVTHQFEKKVHAVLMAYEVYTHDGKVRNYKPAFYIKTP